MIELLLPQLQEILSIVTDHVKDLINNGTVKSLFEIYSRDGNTYYAYTRLHLDKPNPSYKFIEIRYELIASTYWHGNRHVPIQYIKWEKDGVHYNIKWVIYSDVYRWGTVTRKFLFFRWKKEVLKSCRQIRFFEFDSTHDDAKMCFSMNCEDLERMSIDLEDKLCSLLDAHEYQCENVQNYIYAAVERMQNEATQNTLRHFENLLEQSGNTETTTSNLAKQ